MSFSSGDNFHSLYFFYRALFENYFIKYLGFFNKSLFDYTKLDLVTQAIVVLKSDFSVLCSILLVTFFCINSLRNQKNISKKTYVFSVVFIMSVLFTKESLSLVLVRDKTSFMTENSAVFDAGKVSSGPEVFVKISEDDLFFKILTSNLEPFLGKKERCINFKVRLAMENDSEKKEFKKVTIPVVKYFWSSSSLVGKKVKNIPKFLREVDVFTDLSSNELRILTKFLHIREFASEELIIKKGQKGIGFYLIYSGQVRAMIPKMMLPHT